MRCVMAALVMSSLAACGPQIGSLEKGEEGRVVRAYNGDTLVLDTGLRVFLAEIDAPRGKEEYASQAQGELEALALYRNVLLAYGGERRWSPVRPDGPAPPETAVAHVFVRSEGGRWFWLQHALVSRGAAFVRARRDNHARTNELLAIETQARAAQRGIWSKRTWRMLSARAAARAALTANVACTQAEAPFRFVEGVVLEANVGDRRATLALEGAPARRRFSLVVFDDAFQNWSGPPLDTLAGGKVRARGTLGVFGEETQMCLDDASQLELLPPQ